MKIFKYLIVWCAIFNESKLMSTENNSIETNTNINDLNKVKSGSSDIFTATLKNGIVERTTTPSKTKRSTDRLTSNKEFSDENKQHTKRRPIVESDIVKNSRPANTEAPTDLHKSIKRFSDENKQHKESKPTGNGEKVNNPLKMPATSSKIIVSTNTTTPSSSPLRKERTCDPDSINLPRYGIGLIMFAMALMFFIILTLLFMLFKIKRDKHHRDSMNVAIQPKNETNYKYSRQVSGETSNVSTLLKDNTKNSKLVLTRSDSKALFFNNLDTVDKTKDKARIDDIKTSRTAIPESKSSTMKGRPPTLTRILKQPSINHVPISREQMLKLCEGVLSKTKRSNEAISLSDLDKYLTDSKKEEKEKADLEKCLSTPELDSDMYDVLPTPSPRNFFNNSDGVKNEVFNDEVYDNPPKHNIKKNYNPQNKNEKSSDEIYDNPVPNKHDNEVFDDGTYDNPPPNNNRKRNVVVSSDHEDYVMPLTKDNGLYCNAKAYNDNKINNK